MIMMATTMYAIYWTLVVWIMGRSVKVTCGFSSRVQPFAVSRKYMGRGFIDVDGSIRCVRSVATKPTITLHRTKHVVQHSNPSDNSPGEKEIYDELGVGNTAPCCDQKTVSSTPTSPIQSESTTTTTTTTFPTSPLLLEPFLPAADPRYIVNGPVGEGDFILQRRGEPRKQELSNENLIKIVQLQCSDLEVNTLVWKCLGYRFVEDLTSVAAISQSSQTNNCGWSNDQVFPKWKEQYPQPPDFIGMQRLYSKEIDQPSLRANQSLVRSIPSDKKQSLKTHLKPLGFNGYKYAELTPNKTRRAQCTNWLLYFREELFGYSVEELQERRRSKEEDEKEAKVDLDNNSKDKDEWQPPIRQVF